MHSKDSWWFTIYKKNPEILVVNFHSVRSAGVVYHLPKISGLLRRTSLDSSYKMKQVQSITYHQLAINTYCFKKKELIFWYVSLFLPSSALISSYFSPS